MRRKRKSERQSLNQPNLRGLYRRSIIVDFFAHHKTHFTDLQVQLGAALQGAVESRETGLHICEWVDRWRDAGAPPPMPPQLDIISLEDEHRDFRAALGVSVRPRGLADWTE